MHKHPHKSRSFGVTAVVLLGTQKKKTVEISHMYLHIVVTILYMEHRCYVTAILQRKDVSIERILVQYEKCFFMHIIENIHFRRVVIHVM